MIEVKHGSYMDYIFLFGDSRTLHTDLMVQEALHDEDKLFFIAYKNGKPAGYLCASRKNRLLNVLYAYTQEPLRGQGIFQALMEHLIQSTELTIMMNITQENPYFPTVERICFNLGFREHSSYVLYHTTNEKFPVWDEFMDEKGNDLLALLDRWGFSSVSFEECPKEMLEQLYNSNRNEFKNQLNIRLFFDNEYTFLNRKLSFIAMKNGELAAYCLVTSRDGVNVVYEQFSVAEKYIGSGVIFLTLARSMEVCKSMGIKKSSFAISETNKRPNIFYEKVLERMNVSKTKNINYILSRE